MLHSSQRVGRDLATKQQHAGAARDRQTEDRASSRPANDKRAYRLHKVWWAIAKRRDWGNSSFGGRLCHAMPTNFTRPRGSTAPIEDHSSLVTLNF